MFKKKKGKGAIWHASHLLLERAKGEGGTKDIRAEPSVFFLHNQLNIIIGPFIRAGIKEEPKTIKVAAFC